ncbi:MAG: NADH-quinone oxidoreductase subunit L [Planctomycetales bacterium]|nr:NADH-quinone oxidoreductase subunit L [Planctomycetales bacterium]
MVRRAVFFRPAVSTACHTGCTLALADGTIKSVPFQIDVTLRADALTAIMLCMVTFISTLVAIYGSGYMHGDRGYWRFFTYVSLFVFSMTMLVSVSNFLLLFVFWEAVGVCSYLLIGFWYEKGEASAAGMKAFLVNRVGDFGFALAIFLIWVTYGTVSFHDVMADDGSVLIHGLFGNARLTGVIPYATGGTATAICLLLLLGACGKSAQFPLHIWLPDAMEGPTPVSALIHAATMVTAGVYMVVRCTPLFMASPDAQLAVAWIGGGTALLAGLIALTQTDLKRVLAYSTISQLGYMFLALGTGTLAGITAGMFHLFTHAFFKALLFLGSGSVMHAMGNVIDMRRFSGLRHRMPWTYRTFAVGCLALAGVFPFAGFWSKDAVVASVHDKAFGVHEHVDDAEVHAASIAGERIIHSPSGGSKMSLRVFGEGVNSDSGMTAPVSIPSPKLRPSASTLPREGEDVNVTKYGSHYALLYRISLFTAFLTAFYTFRAFYMTFYGDEVIPDEAGHHAHESPPIMWVPLAILAIMAFLAGFYFESGHKFAHFLESTPSLALGAVQDTIRPAFHINIAATSTAIALLGIGLASYFYLGSQKEIEAIANLPGARTFCKLSQNKFYFDELYATVLLIPAQFFAALNYAVDRWVVDGIVNTIGKLPGGIGSLVRKLQTGLIPFYTLAMVASTLVVLFLSQLFWGQG